MEERTFLLGEGAYISRRENAAVSATKFHTISRGTFVSVSAVAASLTFEERYKIAEKWQPSSTFSSGIAIIVCDRERNPVDTRA